MNSRPRVVRQSVAHRAGHSALPALDVPCRIGICRLKALSRSPKSELPEQKISRVLWPFDPAVGGTQGDDHLSGSSVAKGFTRPTRKLSPQYGEARRATSFFLTWSCSQVGFTRTRVATGTSGLLHHLFTLTLRLSSGRYVFCGTFRPLRAHELRGTLPWRARTFLPLRQRRRKRSSILLWQH
jgi:hypothetical protein